MEYTPGFVIAAEVFDDTVSVGIGYYVTRDASPSVASVCWSLGVN
jgi:hypothetical protein